MQLDNMQIDLMAFFGHTRFLAGMFFGWSSILLFIGMVWLVLHD